jgi:hypothetical protein
MGAQAVALFHPLRDHEGDGGVRHQVGLPDAEIEPYRSAGEGFIFDGLAGAAARAWGIWMELVVHRRPGTAEDGHQQAGCQPALDVGKAELPQLGIALSPIDGVIAPLPNDGGGDAGGFLQHPAVVPEQRVDTGWRVSRGEGLSSDS